MFCECVDKEVGASAGTRAGAVANVKAFARACVAVCAAACAGGCFADYAEDCSIVVVVRLRINNAWPRKGWKCSGMRDVAAGFVIGELCVA